MSTLALPLRLGTTKIAWRSRVAVHPLFAPKRLLQLALITLAVVPVPSDDGPFKPHAPVVSQAKPALPLAVKGSR